ncbi:DUF3237 domain-containing protein [Microbacterium sp. 2MCAF23]|uniref:DUF3237 domain-containing protein n=1 Tax=Microbacterium sp. 2MCAF23 TaxID=3232985 RepID=UPI003F9EA453
MVDPLTLTPVCEVIVELGEPLELGATRDGNRRITPILGGKLRTVAGAPFGGQLSDGVRTAELRAVILPGGSDHQLIRPDGAIEIDARYAAQTEDGFIVGIHAVGIRRLSSDGTYFRVAARFETASPTLAYLQDSLFIADGIRERSVVRHVVYRVD